MLEAKDLEMIAEVVTRAIEPLRKDIAELKERMTALEERVTALEERMTALEKRVTVIEENVRVLQKDVSVLQMNMKDLQTDVKNVKLALENEAMKGIYIVAEGHHDLNRKLDLALEKKEEREIMDLRILHLENEGRRIKEKLDIA